MAELFATSKQAIRYHIINILKLDAQVADAKDIKMLEDLEKTIVNENKGKKDDGSK